MLNSRLLALTAVLTASVALPAHADMMFNRVASFAVADNLPADADKKTVTSSEIIAASEDGNTLVYSDSPLGAVGFIDITDARAPKAGGIVKIDGEPTSVTVSGGKVLAGINTSKSKAEPSGNLTVIDLASKAIEASCDLGGQPDSVALSKDGKFLAVAIENERDEEVDDGKIPQMPSGNLKIVSLAAGVPDCATIKTVELTGLSEIAPEDAEPEFVAFNEAGEIAVTLQENNHIAIVDAATAKVMAHFSAGAVTLENIDTKKDGAFKFTGKQENVLREPDAVKWLDNDRLVVANEGDYKGGSRGFTIFKKTGEVVYEFRAFLRICRRQRRPLSGRAQQEGHRAGRHRNRDLRRRQVDLRGFRARLCRRRLQGHRRGTAVPATAAVRRRSGRAGHHSVAQPSGHRQRNRSGRGRARPFACDDLRARRGSRRLSDDHRQPDRRRRAARLGRAFGTRGRRCCRQALRGLGFGLYQRAGNLRDRRDADARR